MRGLPPNPMEVTEGGTPFICARTYKHAAMEIATATENLKYGRKLDRIPARVGRFPVNRVHQFRPSFKNYRRAGKLHGKFVGARRQPG